MSRMCSFLHNDTPRKVDKPRMPRKTLNRFLFMPVSQQCLTRLAHMGQIDGQEKDWSRKRSW
jgi:hypothetical protein